MTVKRLTPNERFQVRVDYVDGERDSLVNSYSRRHVAEKARNSLRDTDWIDRAWVVDTDLLP